MRPDADQDNGLLVEVRRRRSELAASMNDFECALAAPPAAGAAGWSARVRAALSALHDEVAEHIALTEGPSGLYCEVAQRSPRLTHTVDRLTQEHVDIRRRLEELFTWVDVTDSQPDVAETRRHGTDLLVVLMRHRQHGADLLFEAYDLDIGGET